MIDNLVICAGVIAAATTALWILSLMIEDVSIVDIFWGPAFAVVGWTCFAVRDSELTITALLSLTMVSAWGLRLGGYLAWRNLGKGEDFRYQKMREKTGPSFRFKALFTVFYFQGALVLLVSLPVQVALGGDREAPLALLAAGVAIWAIGFLFEAIGDAQLARFKADPDNKGKVMDRGLW
ncbi:MAG: DUF1295 domain-containing protein, partial [Deltaproteobacteria bacterium]|nr:DUF1295 domain-containing protein [Deltaproteobacteria bacterium]